jgi:FtsP/CotA-like multicopper oxidase with cupredoxin domain
MRGAGTGFSRRRFLAASGGATLLAAALPRLARAQAGVRTYRLEMRPAKAALAGPGYPETAVWAFNGSVPGPILRARQGERMRIEVTNRLPEDTSVHWHGMRLPNAMDGVAFLTQKPIPQGGSFTYEFAVPDAGTYWYHPHMRSFEQIDRGLSGALIVDEPAPPSVDRDIVWVLDDWRLSRNAAIDAGFGNMMDMSHGGRIGNTATVNGTAAQGFAVRAGERIRLRLINVANGRLFGLRFKDHAPTIIAYDGQPAAPHAPADGRIVLGPAMRADVILDMTGVAGKRYAVIDDFYPRNAYRLIDLAYGAEPPLRDAPPPPLPPIAANSVPAPALAKAARHEIVLEGGMMGGMTGGMMGGRQMGMREMMMAGRAWTVNGVAAGDVMDAPMMTLKRGSSQIFAMENRTAWFHPMHLHGHSFRVVSRNGQPLARAELRDTELLPPRGRAEIAFVADNPGDWLFHCHIPEHMAGGMMGVVRVA